MVSDNEITLSAPRNIISATLIATDVLVKASTSSEIIHKESINQYINTEAIKIPEYSYYAILLYSLFGCPSLHSLDHTINGNNIIFIMTYNQPNFSCPPGGVPQYALYGISLSETNTTN